MSSTIKCFFLEPVASARVTLRRYASWPVECPEWHGYHNASVAVGVIPWDLAENGLMSDDRDHADPLWPTRCACGYEFADDDKWQHGRTRLHERSDGGGQVTIQEAPVGAMWDAFWMPANRKGLDGASLTLRTPDGDWNIDGPSTNGAGWKRTGTAPNITAHPSILLPKYHGWLRNGVLIEC